PVMMLGSGELDKFLKTEAKVRTPEFRELTAQMQTRQRNRRLLTRRNHDRPVLWQPLDQPVQPPEDRTVPNPVGIVDDDRAPSHLARTEGIGNLLGRPA